MKRIQVFAISLLFAGQALAYDFQSGDLYYNITSSTEPYEVEVTYVNQSMNGSYASLTTVDIPQTVTNSETGITYTVVGVGIEAFHDAVNLVEIKFPKTISYILWGAFTNCKKLSSITLPSGLTAIGRHTFNGAESLTSIEIPSTVTSIGYCAFNSCASLISVTIPNSVKGELDNTFSNCTNLKTVVVGDGVTSIGEFAFSGCKSLETVTLGSAVTKIGWCSFKFCDKLKSIDIPEGVTTIGDDAFFGCYELESVSIPSSVTEIGGSAFVNCRSLVSVELPSGIKAINGATFSGCNKLESVNIPATVTVIGYSAFEGCNKLKSIEIPASVQTIGRYAFADDSLIVSVVIPEKVTKIDDYTFLNCVNLSSVTIQGSVTGIGFDAFKNCINLKTIELPESVERIDIDAFHGSGLTSVKIPEGTTYIGSGAFEDCKNLESVTISPTVERIGSGAFGNCTSLTSVEIPSSVSAIERYAFAYDSALVSVVISDNVKKIEEYTFYNCTSLESVKIPNGVERIGSFSFSGCDNLTSVDIPSSVEYIEWNAFSNCGLVQVEVPSEVATIQSSAFSGVKNLIYKGEATGSPWGALCVNGYVDGDYVFVDNSKTELAAYIGDNDKIVIPNTVETIGANAFADCKQLTSVVIPKSVTKVGNFAFNGCDNLTIYCEAESATDDFGYKWNGDCTVVWGHSGGEIEEPTTYTITLSASVGGSVSDGGTFEEGKEIQIKATANDGYHFLNWSDGNTENPRTITVDKDLTLTAVFEEDEEEFEKYTITLSATNGTVSGGGEYLEGTVTIIKAIPDNGYKFVRWSDGNTENPRSITVDNNLTLTAIIEKDENQSSEPDKYTITLSAENGTVSGGGTFSKGASIQILATPNSGFHFVKWSDGNKDNPRTITVNRNIELTAEISDKYKISAKVKGEGWVSGTGSFSYGQTITIKATADDNYHFTKWNDGDKSRTRTITVTEDLELTATFSPDLFEISTQKTDGGKIKGADIYSYGEEVEIKAVPDEGYKFVSWSDGNTDNPRTIIVKGDKTYSAEFAPAKFTITAVAENGSVTGLSEEFAYGDTATLTATAADGFRFVKWSDDNTENPRIVVVAGDVTFTAVFEADENQNEEKQTAVPESVASALNIYAYGNTIVVENAGSEIRVYDAIGDLVGGDIARPVSTITVNGTGVYIVKVGSVAKRVMIN